MTLPAGTKLGSYEVIGPLGAGGMGEVYRARDAKLDRDVAIKVLPERLASDSAALQRRSLDLRDRKQRRGRRLAGQPAVAL